MSEPAPFHGTLSGDAHEPAPPLFDATLTEGLAAPDLDVARELGRGGMGIVWLATQRSLDRPVAVKTLRPERAGGLNAEKFAEEARVTGRLEHPNIPPVHAFGRDEAGRPFLCMKLVKGIEWARLLEPRTDEERKRADSMDLRSHLELIIRVCEAIAFAHAQGVIHRDLKPENVMVGEFGEVLVMDWGVALDLKKRDAEARGSGTKYGATVGTPAYMAPEMAIGDEGGTGPWTDVYLLGGMLYELLTGTPPHRGEGLAVVLMAAAEGRVEPPALRAPGRSPPDALADVAMRALAPEPEKRFGSATALAAAIREYLRNEASVKLSVAALTALWRLDGAIAGGRAASTEAHAGLSAAIVEFQQALELWRENRAAREGLERARLAYAGFALREGNLELAEAQLHQLGAPEAGPAAKLRTEIAAVRDARAAARLRSRALLAALALAIAVAVGLIARETRRANAERRAATRNLARVFHEMGRASLRTADARTAEVLFAKALTLDDTAASREGLLDARSRGARLAWTGPQRTGSTAVALSRDGLRLAAADEAGAIRLYDIGPTSPTSVEAGRVIAPPAGRLHDLELSPDGLLLAAAGEGGAVVVLDVLSGEERRRFPGHVGTVWSVAWSPDGRRLASAGSDQTARIHALDAVGGEVVLRGHDATVYGVAFRPDGREVATGSWDGSLRLWDPDAPDRAPRVIRAPGWVFEVAYSPDGKHIAAGNDQTTIVVHDAATGAEVATLAGHERQVQHLAFGPDGRRLVSAATDRTVRVWDVAAGKATLALRAAETEEQGVGVAFGPDGQRLALAGFDRRVQLWDLDARTEVATLRGHERAAAGVAFSPDGRRLASSSWDCTLRIWDTATRREVRVLRGHEDQVEEISWGRLGRTIASGGSDRTVRLWDAATGALLRTLRGHGGRIAVVSLAPDEALVASASEDGTARVWEVATGREVHVLRGHVGAVFAVAFSPDGKRIATGGADHDVRIFDVASGAETLVLRGATGEIEGVAWAPDGRRLAAGSWDRTVRIWDAATGAALHTLRGHEGWAYGVAFSPDGRRLASASEDGTLRLWDAEAGRPLLVLGGHLGEVQTVAFAPDGDSLASASYDATIRLWSLRGIEELLGRSPAALAADAERHTGLRVDTLLPAD